MGTLSATFRAIAAPTAGNRRRYAVAVVAVGVAWLLRATVLTQAEDRSPFMAFGLAVLVSGLLAGAGPGLLATGLSSVVAVFYYLPPELALAVHDPFDGVQLAFFVLEGFVAAAIGGLARQALIGARDDRTERRGRFLGRAAIDGRWAPWSGRRGQASRRLVEPLTERELEIAELLVSGDSNEEIASALFLSTNTVKTHLKHIYGKLGVGTRTQAVMRCVEFGLLADKASGAGAASGAVAAKGAGEAKGDGGQGGGGD